MPMEIVICPTVREADGLAISSRNQYLNNKQRKDAALIYKSLQKCRDLINDGVIDSKKIIAEMQKILQQVPSIKIEYISIVDAETLQNLDQIAGLVLAAVAAKIGSARLIDNILVDTSK
jgi:pantoate--beta-alanine ligase